MRIHRLLRRACVAASLVAGLNWSVASTHAQWGNLKGQFILDGDIPALEMIDNMKEPVCAKKIPSDDLIVNKDGKGISDIFVYIPAVKKPTVHPDLKAPKDKEVVLDQKDCRFTPHALFLRTEQTLLVKSMDDCNHNTRVNPVKERNQGFNDTLPAKFREGRPWKANVAETYPTQVKCDIHTWMTAYCLVLDHPYAAVTDKDGKFEIKDLPAGDLEFRYWHGKVGNIERAVTLKIKTGETTDLGKIKVPVAKFTETK